MHLKPDEQNLRLQQPDKSPSPHSVTKSTSTVATTSIDLDNQDYYFNRELSHFQFNIRVLEQALHEDYPLLERLRFLLIFSSNIDEFFEIRVSGLRQQVQFGREHIGIDGTQIQTVLDQISEVSHEQVKRQYQILNQVLIPQMNQADIFLLKRNELTDKQKNWVKTLFFQQVMPVISPIGLDPSHPFPRLANKILNFIVELDGKDAFGRETGMAIVPAPRSLSRIFLLPPDLCPKNEQHYIFLSSIIHQHAEDLFPGMEVKGCYQFRITRNSDLSVDDDTDDLASALRGELLARRYGDAVRLEVVENCPQHLTNFLLEKFDLTERELYKVNGPVNLIRLMDICHLKENSCHLFPSFAPGFPSYLPKKSVQLFATISKSDILLLHPFQTFSPVTDLLRHAANDPKVLAIKQTLYRTGSRSEIVDALVEAARHGKEVTVVVEIRARFDEEENLKLARRLQEAGAIIVYGVMGYKTHAKMMLIVRKEGRKIVRYAHLGTGNYHAANARLYTDYSLMTCDKDLTNDVHKVFQQLTGMGKTVRVKKLFHAPFTLKKSLIELINREAEFSLAGKKTHIIIKVNAITDPDIIKALYKASMADVRIDLIIRGICSLKPKIPGISDNIRVYSIIGRFLEHNRVHYFHNDGTPKVYCSSADLMVRNLTHRVEVCFPVEHPKLIQRIKKELDYYLTDNTGSWRLNNDGTYEKRDLTRKNQKVKNAQSLLLEQFSNS